MIKNIRTTLKNLINDTKGDDASSLSSGISRGGYVVIGALGLTAVGGGIAASSNTANATSDKTGEKIAGSVGAQAATASTVQNPFGGGK
jgi:hypothetical protein